MAVSAWRSRILLVALALLVVPFAGCLGDDDADGATAPDQADVGADLDEEDGNVTARDDTRGDGDAGKQDPPTHRPPPGNETGGSNETDEKNETDATPRPPAWPSLENATVRPGVQVTTALGQCTSNFVFKGAQNDTLYVGLAAHCAYATNGTIHRTATVWTIDGEEAFDAPIVFNSWQALGDAVWQTGLLSGEPVLLGHPFDFALIEIPREHHGLVHPAMLSFGGPTHLAGPDDIQIGGTVACYGNSELWPPQLFPYNDAANRHEGVITEVEEWSVRFYGVTPVVPGDSGAPVILTDGGALGITSSIRTGPINAYGFPEDAKVYQSGSTAASHLPMALAWLDEQGWPLELQTWELLYGPTLP